MIDSKISRVTLPALRARPWALAAGNRHSRAGCAAAGRSAGASASRGGPVTVTRRSADRPAPAGANGGAAGARGGAAGGGGAAAGGAVAGRTGGGAASGGAAGAGGAGGGAAGGTGGGATGAGAAG